MPPEMTEAERLKRIAELEAASDFYRKIGGSWGGLSRIAKEADKSGADPANHRQLLREAQAYLDRIAAAVNVKREPAKGETVLRFEIGQPQELAAGLTGWSASVEVSFQDGFEVDADVAEAIRSTLAECADGYCRTAADAKVEP